MMLQPEGKFLVTNLSLEEDCHEVEVTPDLELLVTFSMSFEGVFHEFYTKFHYKLISNLKVTYYDDVL
jgi:hypothetical protein